MIAHVDLHLVEYLPFHALHYRSRFDWLQLAEGVDNKLLQNVYGIPLRFMNISLNDVGPPVPKTRALPVPKIQIHNSVHLKSPAT